MTTVDLRPARLNYKIQRGDDFSDTITISEGSPAVPVDVSARTYAAKVRRTPNGDVVGTMTIDMTDAATGVVGYALSNTITDDMSGKYVWDFQQTTGGSVRTLLAGTFTVDLDVTRA